MMIRTVIFIGLTSIAFGCSSNNQVSNNPYLFPPSFSITIDTNLPFYNNLKNIGSSVYVAEGGITGIYVSNTGSGFVAFEATCPNHAIKSCSRIANENNGLSAKCGCEAYEYNLLTGNFLSKENAPETIYTLLPYAVSSSDSSVISISN